jgi:hypothetical protein
MDSAEEDVLAYMTFPKAHWTKLQHSWAVQRSRYMTLETIATMSDDPLISLPAAS